MILNQRTSIAGALLLCAVSASARPRVAATFSILGDWARAVGGADADVAVLVGPDGDSHAYEPTPADARALAGADVVLEIGMGFEPWLDKLMAASGSRARRVCVTEKARRPPAPPSGGAGGAAEDPHVWGDPTNAALAVEALRDALIAADPERAEAYRRRAGSYLAALKSLDEWIRALVSRVPSERRLLVTAHDTLGPWARRYGFRVVSSLISSFSTDAVDPSAARLAALSDELRALKVPAIFVENVSNDRVARAVAAAAGVRVAPPLYTDALGAPGTPGGDYIGMMRYDAQVIVEALK